jgi:hypothetical protein
LHLALKHASYFINSSVPSTQPVTAHKLTHLIKVDNYGWQNHLHPRPSFSLSIARKKWKSTTQVRYNTLVDEAWSRADFLARPLGPAWPVKAQPHMAASPSRLVIVAGNLLYSYAYSEVHSENEVPGIYYEGWCNLSGRSSRRDATAVIFAPEDPTHTTIYVGFEDGIIQRIKIIPNSSTSQLSLLWDPNYRFDFNGGDLVESLSTSCGDLLLSFTSLGHATLTNTSTLAQSQLTIKARSWSSYLTPTFAAFGTSSHTPLVVHDILETGELSPTPSAYLHPKEKNAVYGICAAPPSSPWGASPQILVSGWYDGSVRIFDLRDSASASYAYPLPTTSAPSSTEPWENNTSSSSSPTRALRPTLTLSDPFSDDALYSVSSGGGSGAHIAAGFARHSVVSFWDVRSPRTSGWGVHAPGNDPSPVYSLILESSRLFGATQARPFLYDFGAVNERWHRAIEETYPPDLGTTMWRNGNASGSGSYGGHKKDAVMHPLRGTMGFYVTKYNHQRRW